MKDYNNFDRKLKSEINMLAGSLNLPETEEYLDLATFLHDVGGKFGKINF